MVGNITHDKGGTGCIGICKNPAVCPQAVVLGYNKVTRRQARLLGMWRCATCNVAYKPSQAKQTPAGRKKCWCCDRRLRSRIRHPEDSAYWDKQRDETRIELTEEEEREVLLSL